MKRAVDRFAASNQRSLSHQELIATSSAIAGRSRNSRLAASLPEWGTIFGEAIHATRAPFLGILCWLEGSRINAVAQPPVMLDGNVSGGGIDIRRRRR